MNDDGDGRLKSSLGLVSLNEENTVGQALSVLIDEANANNSRVVVMAGGRDRTMTIVQSLANGNPCVLFVPDTEPRGKPAALNKMFALMNTPIVILSDGDVRVKAGAVRLLTDAMAANDVGAASGRVVGIPGDYNGIEKACDLMTEMMHLSRIKRFRTSGTLELATGYLYGIKREFVRDIPEDMNSDDGFLSLCVRSAGKRIAYVPAAQVAIRYPGTLADFVKQKMRTRTGHLQLMAEFRGSSPRSARSEIGEYRLMREAAESRGYGFSVSILALVLTGLAWSAAYMRRYLPWLFRKRVWQPIGSTK